MKVEIFTRLEIEELPLVVELNEELRRTEHPLKRAVIKSKIKRVKKYYCKEHQDLITALLDRTYEDTGY